MESVRRGLLVGFIVLINLGAWWGLAFSVPAFNFAYPIFI